MSSAFALLLRPTLRRTALTPLPAYARCITSHPNSNSAQANDALEALSEVDEEGVTPPVPYLDLDLSFPSSSSTAKENLPQLMNIPPPEDPLLHFLASSIMRNGNRAKASRIVSNTLLNLHAYTRQPPLPLLRQAIFACAPAVRVLYHKHSTKIVHKPVALSEKQGIWYAVNWLLKECKGRQGGPKLEERLAREIIKVLKGESEVLNRKKADLHKLAMVNRGNIDGLR